MGVDRDRLRLGDDHVRDDDLLARLRQAEPVQRGLQDHPRDVRAKAEKFIAENTIRTETDQNIPVVKVPAGGDGYLIARLWAWYPILELEKGQTYKIHLSSMDYNHGFSLQPVNINIQVIPGYEHVVKMTPTKEGTYAIVCNEYCGIGHHSMLGRIYVK
jgi:cytochrome c oxidase subunit 2